MQLADDWMFSNADVLEVSIQTTSLCTCTVWYECRSATFETFKGLMVISFRRMHHYYTPSLIKYLHDTLRIEPDEGIYTKRCDIQAQTSSVCFFMRTFYFHLITAV